MLSVLKIGGSVLRDAQSYARVAEFLAQRLGEDAATRLVVIVSAQYGVTDALLRDATEITAAEQRRSRLPAVGARAGRPTARGSGSSSTRLSGRRARCGAARAGAPPLLPVKHTESARLPQEALDLLWSTGEIRSVALLALHLERLGVHPAALNVHQAGLGVADTAAAGVVDVRPLHLLSALGRARIAIVPGFFAVRPGGAIASLGRGGSDLTAVLLASALHADACELVKDVPGYFTADPHVHADATPIHQLGIDAAIEMAAAGCDLVQAAALHAAQRTRLPILVRSLDSAAHVTRLLPRSAADGVLDQDDSCRAAVGA